MGSSQSSPSNDRAPSPAYCPDRGDEEPGGRPSDWKLAISSAKARLERFGRWRIPEFIRKKWMASTRDEADIEMGGLQGFDESANQGQEHAVTNNGAVSSSHPVHSVGDPNFKAPSVQVQDGWASPTFVLGATGVLGLLGISDYTIGSDGTTRPKYLFRRHPASFYCFMMANSAACFLVVIGTAFQQRFPFLAKAIHGLAWTSVMLSVTVLLWELLPGCLSWFPWAGFGITLFIIFGRPAYEYATK